MGFLSATGNIIEAVLTRKGRDLLTKGQFNITKYAFTDDGVNYNLYDENLGEDADVAILSLPVTEPTTNEAAIRNMLVTLPSNTRDLWYLTLDRTTATLNHATGIDQTTITVNAWNIIGGDTYKVDGLDNTSSFNQFIDITNNTSANYTQVIFSYKSNAIINEQQEYSFRLKGDNSGILTDVITLTVGANQTVPVGV